ncbi:DUF6944 family repetitive protein [Niallia sp. Sow4_A1]|uniref:DUF6944 family repetitive protein n=1 Tax=Bacillaceae TaxID=186817 RepID=UPI00065FDD5D|nr:MULTISPECIES: hypothetical protein [Bacillaceae]MCF2649191.1 hypothetical protein [Niallia circulans]CAI9395150.1 hypothetical protein BACSP_00888 [Bacillus sp. T2.9-1]
MKNQVEIASVWVQAIGAILAALGNSAWNLLSEEEIKDLDLIGNVLQTFGNAVQADQQETITYEKIGAEIQAIGNTVVASSYILLEDELESKLIIKGNWLQAFGAIVEAVDEVFDNSGKEQTLNILGNTTQAVGNSFQAIGEKHILFNNNDKGKFLVISGSWIQAVGTILNAIGQTDEELTENNHVNQNKSMEDATSFYEQENLKHPWKARSKYY